MHLPVVRYFRADRRYDLLWFSPAVFCRRMVDNSDTDCGDLRLLLARSSASLTVPLTRIFSNVVPLDGLPSTATHMTVLRTADIQVEDEPQVPFSNGGTQPTTPNDARAQEAPDTVQHYNTTCYLPG